MYAALPSSAGTAYIAFRTRCTRSCTLPAVPEAAPASRVSGHCGAPLRTRTPRSNRTRCTRPRTFLTVHEAVCQRSRITASCSEGGHGTSGRVPRGRLPRRNTRSLGRSTGRRTRLQRRALPPPFPHLAQPTRLHPQRSSTLTAVRVPPFPWVKLLSQPPARSLPAPKCAME